MKFLIVVACLFQIFFCPLRILNQAKQQSPVREGEPFLFSSENNSTGDGATAVSTIKWSWEEDEAS